MAYTGFLTRVVIWDDVALDVTDPDVRLVMLENPGDELGNNIVDFYGPPEVWNAGENQGSGGDFIMIGEVDVGVRFLNGTLFVDPDLFHGVWAEANIIKMKGLISPPKQRDCARIFGGCKRAGDMSKKDLKDWYYGHAERVLDDEGRMIIPEIIGYIHNFSLEDSPFGEPFVDAYCNNWWATKEDMFKTFNGDIWKRQLEHREDHIDVYNKSLFIGALAMEHIIDLPK